ncbi:Ig-like domain-containing protein [Paenibacillus doosanensis]|nr:Ig-like domain-containing protein [Paenibacillus doosanensis]
MLSVIFLTAGLTFILRNDQVHAEGSRELVQNGGYRPYLEWDVGNFTSGIERKATLYTYAISGETLNLGSSVPVSSDGRDIVVTKPSGDVINLDVTTADQGLINTVAKETAGPYVASSNTAGYNPLTVHADQTGWYKVEFHSPGGGTGNPKKLLGNQNGFYSSTTTANKTIQSKTVGAWDITVKDASGNIKNGRTFSYYLPLNMGSNGINLNSNLYVLTKDGYLYLTDMNGIDPWGFIFFSNNRGYIDGNTTLYRSISFSKLTDSGVTVQNPGEADTETDKTHRIFFNKPSADLPADVPTSPVDLPTISGFQFKNKQETSNMAKPGDGGTFEFVSDKSGTYQLIIDTDGDKEFDPTKDVVLENVLSKGLNKVNWNGKNRSGTANLPVGTYPAKLIIKGGEYHFPLLDVEVATNGIKINMENPPGHFPSGITSSTIYYNDSNYTTSNGTFLNDINGTDASKGVNSTNGAHAFPDGNNIAMDTWTYFPGPTATADVVITNTTISGNIYNDINGNGVKDTGESGLANVTLTVTDSADIVQTITTDTNGDYSTPVTQGSVTVQVTGGAGLTGYSLVSGSASQTKLAAADGNTAFELVGYAMDTTPPAPPVITGITNDTGNSGSDGLTNDNTLEIKGTAEANSTVSVYKDGQFIGTVTANESGSWSLDYTSTALPDGSFSLTATATDRSGNTSDPSAAFPVAIDTATHVSITSPVNGSSTKESKPVISGTAEPGDTIVVKIDGIMVSDSVIAGNDGKWSFTTTDALTEGVHTVDATAADAAGNTADAVQVSFTIDSSTFVAIAAPANGSKTKETKPVISGTVEAGDTIVLKIDGVMVSDSVIADTDGKWSFTTTNALTEGVHTVDATATDTLGNTADAAQVSFTIDSSTFVTIAAPADSSTTKESKPLISGTAEPGDTIVVKIDEVVVSDSVIAGNDGKWSFTPSNALIEGVHTVDAMATDTLGNTANAEQVNFTIDSSTFVAIAAPANGSTTKESKPLISGTAEAGDTVVVKIDGVMVSDTVIAGNDGKWSFTTSDGLTEGVHIVDATATDTLGNTADAAQVSFTVDTSTFVAIAAPADGSTTKETKPVISGNAEAGDTIVLKIDGVMVSDSVIAGNDGKWSFTTTSALTEGVHTVDATATDTLGNTADAVQVNFTIDSSTFVAIAAPADGSTTKETKPVISGTAEAGDTIVLKIDGVMVSDSVIAGNDGKWSFTTTDALTEGVHTVDATATDTLGNTANAEQVNFTIDSSTFVAIAAPADGSTTKETKPVISGTAEAGDTVVVKIDGVMVSDTVIAGNDGKWSFTTTNALTEGVHTVDATATDTLGNTADAAQVSFTIDSSTFVAIAAPANGSTTKESKPVISGTAEAGDTIVLKIDGVMVSDSVIAGNDGKWSFTPASALTEGVHTVDATANDTLGNIADAVQVSFTVDTSTNVAISAPANGSTTKETKPVISGTAEAGDTIVLKIDGVMVSDSVIAGNDGKWSFTTTNALTKGVHTVDATATDTLGNTADAAQVSFTIDSSTFVAIAAPANGSKTKETKPVISGTAEAGDTIVVKIDGVTASDSVIANGEGKWSFTPASALTEGVHTVNAAATDTLGNIADAAQVSFNIDSSTFVAIAAPANGSTTKESKPVISGTAEAGDTIVVKIDGVMVSDSVIAGNDGKWSFTPASALTEGVHTVDATATDTLGNTADAAQVSFTIDSSTFVAIAAPANGSTTKESKPVISGAAEPGATIVVKIDGVTASDSVIANGEGKWSFTTTNALAEGVHTVDATATDTLGNTADAAQVSFTVNTLPDKPAAPIHLASSNTTQTTTDLSWDSVSGATYYTIYKDDQVYKTNVASHVFEVTGLTPDTTYEFTVSASNAGGESVPSNTVQVTTLPSWSLALTAGDTTQTAVNLNWNTVTEATYYILYKDNAKLATVTDTVYLADGLSSGTTYTFKVDAFQNGKWMITSNTVTVTTGVHYTDSGIFGTIYSATGGRVANLGVELLDGTGTRVIASAVTDASGQYTFTELEAGTYNVVAPRLTKQFVKSQAAIQRAEHVKVDLILPENGALGLTAVPDQIVGDGVSTSELQATLFNKSGQPVQNVPIQFFISAGSISDANKNTDANGLAKSILTAPVIEGVLPRVEKASVMVRDEEHGIFAEKEIAITFLPASVEGIVTNGGLPVAHAIVHIAEDFDGDGVIDYDAQVVTGADGKYNIVVPRGDWEYTIHIAAPVKVGNKTVTVESEQTSKVGTLTGKGETVQANRQITGSVFVADSNNGDPQEVNRVFTQGEHLSGLVLDQDGRPLDKTITIHSNGSYKVDNIEPGTYNIIFQVTAPTGEKLAGARLQITVKQNGELAIATTLIDPYGTVTDKTTNQPVSDVHTELYWANTALNISNGRTPGELVPLPELPGFMPNMNKNPQSTTNTGQYAWMVFQDADYYIKAAKEGYAAYDSRVEGRNQAADPGEDSYIANGIIHVGKSIVLYNFSMTPNVVSDDSSSDSSDDSSSPGTSAGPAPTAPETPEETPTETGTHFYYVTGYPDGMFKPERNVSRAEVATVFTRILYDTIDAPEAKSAYADVPESHWAKNYIAAATKEGIMQGYPGNVFLPEGPITRAEMAAVVVRYKHLALLQETGFNDTEQSWAKAYISTAKKSNLLDGYLDGSYRPDQPLTRAEFVTIVNRLLSRGPLKGVLQPSWPDVPKNYWAWENIEEASRQHEYEKTTEAERLIRFID